MSYRAPGRSSRTNRTAHDHDVFEGLPVRRWTKEWVTIQTRPSHQTSAQPDHPLPKDATLLSETARGLLAAARNAGTNTGDAAEQQRLQKERELQQQQQQQQAGGLPLFATKRWVAMPRNLEAEIPEPVYLCKVPGISNTTVVLDGTGQGTQKERLIIGGAGGGSRRRNPPPPNKKKAKRGRKKKVDVEREAAEKEEAEKKAAAAEAETLAEKNEDVEMMDVDAATTENPMPETVVGKEVEKLEIQEEQKVMEGQKTELAVMEGSAPENKQ